MSWIFNTAKILMEKKRVQELSHHLSQGYSAARDYAKDFHRSHFCRVWKEANEGEVESQFQVAEAYFKGKGIDNSIEEAAKWYTHAANGGHPRAQCTLAMLTFLGRGIAQSNRDAWKWMRLALMQDDLEAAQAWISIHGKISEEEIRGGDRDAMDFKPQVFINVPPPIMNDDEEEGGNSSEHNENKSE